MLVGGNGLLLGIEADANWSGIDGEGLHGVAITKEFDLKDAEERLDA